MLSAGGTDILLPQNKIGIVFLHISDLYLRHMRVKFPMIKFR